MQKAKNLFLAILASFSLLAPTQAQSQVVSGAKRLDLGATPLTGATSAGDIESVTVTGTAPVTVSGSPCTTGDCAFTLGLEGVTLDADGWHFSVSTPGSAPTAVYEWEIVQTGGGYPTLGMTFGVDGLRLNGDYGEIHGYRKIAVHKPASGSGDGFCFQDGGTNACIAYDWLTNALSLPGDVSLLTPLPITSGGIGQAVFEPHQVLVGPATGTAPDDNNYPTVRALVAADLPAMTATGPVASLPAAGVAGRVYYPTDSWYTYRDTGSAWEAFRNGRIMYPLDDSGWTGWQNESTATRSTSRGTLTLSKPIAASGDSQSLRYKTAPATPYTITACLRYGAKTSAASQYIQISIGGRESSSGKLKMITPFHGNGTWTAQASKWNSPTSYNSDIAVVTPLSSSSDTDVWVRMTDNGTNVLFDVSYDGFDWFNVATDGRTNFCTIDQIFVSIQATSAAYTGQVFTASVLSYREE